MPTVSVIVPNYNHAPFLRQRIDTILGQTYQDFELILLDDCSTDNSQEILADYAEQARAGAPVPRTVRLEFNKKNSGTPFKQWNKGVRMARGKYVWIAESDDYADARFLERLVPVLESNHDVQFVYCRSQQVTGRGKVLGALETFIRDNNPARWHADFCVDGKEELTRSMVYGCIVENASAVVLRKAAYERAGGADEAFRICGDWKLWCTLMLAGKMAYVAEPLNYFRFHDGAVRNRLGLWGAGIVEWLTVVRWLLDRMDVPEKTMKQVRAYQAGRWVRAVLRSDVPWVVKGEILRVAKTIDPHLLRRGMRAALLLMPTIVAEQGRQIWCKAWYGLLDLTYGARHSHGLTRQGLTQARAKIGIGRETK